MNKDFNEFLRLLNYHKVKYVVVGAHAVGIYSKPRATGDLDVLIETTKKNARKVIKVLEDFGFGALGLTSDDFFKTGWIVQLGREPVRIDILTSITGVDWKDIWKNKVRGIFGSSNVPVHFIGKDQLIKNKKLTGRLQDLADVKTLQDMGKKKGNS